jgi:hypothetical protein
VCFSSDITATVTFMVTKSSFGMGKYVIIKNVVLGAMIFSREHRFPTHDVFTSHQDKF